MVMSHGGSAVHLRSGSNAACKWTRYGPHRGCESLNLAHESDSSPSPGLESYNTETEKEKRFGFVWWVLEKIWMKIGLWWWRPDDFCRMCFVDSNDRFSFAIAIFLVVHRRRILVIVLSPPNNSPKHIERCDWVNTNGVRPINFHFCQHPIITHFTWHTHTTHTHTHTHSVYPDAAVLCMGETYFSQSLSVCLLLVAHTYINTSYGLHSLFKPTTNNVNVFWHTKCLLKLFWYN